MEYALLIITGCAIGSFFSVVVARVGRQPGIFTGRSQCPQCRHRLAWYDMVPLVSFAALSGRCRYCKDKVSWWYPFLEVVCAAVLVLWYRQYGPGISIADVGWLCVTLGFVALAACDARTFTLPDALMLPVGVLAIALALERGDAFEKIVLAAFLAAVLFGILYAVSRGTWIGFGDIKLTALIGVVFPYQITLIVIMGAIVLAAGAGATLWAAGRATGRTPLPFGAFVASVAATAILFINELRLLTGFIPYIF